MDSVLRLLLVDDQVLFLESLKTVLELRSKDVEVVGLAHDGDDAISKVEELAPDLVLMDVRMPGMDGVEAVRRIHERDPAVKVLMLTTFDDDAYVREAMTYGAVGYILKNIPADDLLSSIRAVRNGTVQLSPDIVNKIIGPSGTTHQLSVDLFSRREREILYLLSKGLDNTAIGRRLYLAEQTVKNHISKIYSKMGRADRFQAIELAKALELEHYCSYLD